ncbi:NPC intracellular sterol transporter 1-related protein 1 [Trichomonascus vanleenenianus]|uniref:sphingolipid transporter n=1 Tax=Trichomonascus vanleenenianus TaxID=2268995 RepID=UPI003EC95F41
MCAMYGQCGKKSIFGSELPCAAEVEAKDPDEETRKALVELCGEAYAEGPVCCSIEQVDSLRQSLKKAESLIATCPACKQNFFQFFCRFTCSPDQSTFLDIKKTGKSKTGKEIVTELDHYVDPKFASVFYDSCKEVKFSATNGYAMDFIGGGAKDYKAFLKFLGDEKPLLGGSPFQMNFPWDDTPREIIRSTGPVYNCSDRDYKCPCSDCAAACPVLREIEPPNQCRVGALPCLTFGIIIVYIGGIFGLTLAYGGFRCWKTLSKRNLESRRLLYGGNDYGDDSGEEDYEDDEYYYRLSSISRFRFRDSNRLRSPYPLNSKIQSIFTRGAYFCARFPAFVITVSLAVVAVMCLGAFNIELETSPVRLWVSPQSREFGEKQFFDEHFGPFYRAEQVFVVNDTGPVLNYDTLEWWFGVESRIQQLQSDTGVSIDDICLNPLGDACVIQSVTQYFGGDIRRLSEKNWQKQLRMCTKQPLDCMPPFQRPMEITDLFGGFTDDDPITSKSLVITYVVNNGEQGTEQEEKARSWEKEMIDLMLQVQQEASNRGLRLSFNTEMSLEKELNKSSNTDANIVAISYVAMFLYASLALGGVVPCIGRMSLVRSKFSLGLFGVFVVLLSVAASVGFFAFIGLKVTLIIAEVIPFLVLAVGVDNIFLLTHELNSVNISHPSESIEQRVARAVGRIGPSILLSASCESIAFALGGLVAMPAVRNFAFYSAGAVFVNAVLQLTMFVSALSLDQLRTEQNRYDCLPFLQADKRTFPLESFSRITARALGSPSVFEKFDEPLLTRLVRKYYAPALISRKVKVAVLTIFAAWFGISIALLPNVQMGLDQRLAVPADSYLVDYFNDLYAYFNVGPPVYFITNGMNATERADQQALCGRFSTCQEYSLINIVEQERKRPEVSFINAPAASWIDDFLQWLNPSLEDCCRFRKGTNETMFCSPLDPASRCQTCFANKKWEITMEGLPEGAEFMRFFKEWIQSPSDPCPLGGKAPYSTSVSPNYERNTIASSSFRTSHVPLKSQDDFINSYKAARRIARDISDSTGIETFPYANFYIFFAQYLTIVQDTFRLVGFALLAIFALSAILLGTIRTALVVTATVGMIVVNIAGIMAVWNIGLNAVSLVNLVICVGIGVEFCIHIARAFTFTQKVTGSGMIGVSRDTRVFNALVGVGVSVFGGIALTKLIGVSVLAFTHSKIFEVYYFRMWVSLVLVATAHSLVLLPVLLTYFGGVGYILDQGDQGIADDLASRLYDSGINHMDNDGE